MRHRLIISYRGKQYKLLSFEFCDHADGSLYITFDRELSQRKIVHLGSGLDSNNPLTIPETQKFRISYHASGIVNYHGVKAPSIFSDPIYRIEREFGIACLSVGRIEQLSSIDSDRPSDVVAPLDADFSGRVTFRLGMMPSGAEPVPVAFARVDYASWFALGISLTQLPKEIPTDIGDIITTVTPRRGQYDAPLVSKDEALIAFHRKELGATPHLCYWEPTKGIGRIIFNVVMVRPPELRIQFANPSFQAEIITVSCAEVRFKVRGPAGYLKGQSPETIGFTLDAGL